jgi:hypothetical protein
MTEVADSLGVRAGGSGGTRNCLSGLIRSGRVACVGERIAALDASVGGPTGGVTLVVGSQRKLAA